MTIAVTLPVTITADRIDVHQAKITTAASGVFIDGSLSDLQNPRIAMRIAGNIAVADLKNAAGLPFEVNARGVPVQIDLAADVRATENSIEVDSLRVAMGRSNIEAFGPLESGNGAGSLIFRSTLDAPELAKLVSTKFAAPAGVVTMNGNLQLHARDLNLTGFDASVLGGRLTGAASLRNFQTWNLSGNLRGFDVADVLRAFQEKLPYDAIVSGAVHAGGDIKTPNSVAADAQIEVSPARRGVAVSGKVNASYNERADNVAIEKSWIALPHTRIDINGSLGKTIDVSARSRDLSDLFNASRVSLNRGEADLIATITGGLSSPRISGHILATRVAVQGRQFDSVGADFGVSKAGIELRNGTVARAPMQARFAASVGLSDWRPLPREPISASASLMNADMADIAALADQNPADYSGALAASLQLHGTVGNPGGAATIDASNGTIANEHFDRAQLRAELTDQMVNIPIAYVQAGAGRVDLNARFRHPRDSFTSGQLQAAVRSNAIDLAKTAAAGQRAKASGTLQIDTAIAGTLNGGAFVLTSLTANIAARSVHYEAENYGDLQATAQTSGQNVAYTLNSDFAGSTVRINGSTQLVSGYPTNADASVANLSVEKLLAAARRNDIAARGTLNGSAHWGGTLSNPQAEANFDLSRAVLYDQPIDHLRLRGSWLPTAIDVSELQVEAGPSRISLSARYDHQAGSMQAGNAKFDIESSHLNLARIHYVEASRPGLDGTVDITARGEGAVTQGGPRIRLRDLKLNLSATGIAVQGKSFGDLRLTANSNAGNGVNFALNSSLAGSKIQASGDAELTDGYPINARMNFENVLYANFADLLGRPVGAQFPAIAADGGVTVNGPLLNRDQLRAAFQLTRLSITAGTRAGQAPMVIANQGTISATLDRGRVEVQNAHLSGPQTDIQVSGSASVTAKTLAFNVNGKAGLGILPRFRQDIYSAGSIDLNATVRGTMSQPLLNGRLVLEKATFNYAGLPVGIANANGIVEFSGNNATITNFTAESGGGKVTLSGFAAYSGVMRFDLRMHATRVLALIQQGVSVTTSADLELSGTPRRSLASGTLTVDRITYNPRTDLMSILSRGTPPAQSVTPQSSLLNDMRLAVRVRTSSGLAVVAEMAQSLSASADIQIQGTAAEPRVLGKVTINEGQLSLLGNTYTVSSGTISFYNPLQIIPVIDFSLKTQTQGVDVVIHVTGRVDDMKLSYTSNPPLAFQEIVGLLAAGRTPTSDPTLLANQPDIPPASVEQMGESAVLGQAIANPLANRLQRVFGVSQLSLAPSFQQGTQTPTARVTLTQRITNNVTFVYTSAFDDPNGEIVTVQWAFDPRWTAVATRDQNGIFSINFLYKRQFR